MSFTKVFLLFLSFLVSVNALATPHLHRAVHHRALAGRVAVPAPIDLPATPVRRRQNSKRCRPRPSSSHPSETETTNPPPQTTATHAAPAPTTSHKPAHTSNKEDPPAPTKKPSPLPSSNLPSFLVGAQSGDGTFYSTGLGACGITNKDTDYIAAVSHLLFDAFPNYDGANPNHNPICNRKVTATYKGKKVTVAITDRCEGCKITDLDFSPSAFNQLADFSLGRIGDVTWVWD